jgi:hypothetical protein
MVDLKNHLFQAIERLNDDSLSDEQIKTEISMAQAIADIGKVIVDGAKTTLLHAKITGRLQELNDEDFGQEPKRLSNSKK